MDTETIINDEKKLVIEVTISMTGETFSVEISQRTTAGQIISGLMEFHSLELGLGRAWKLLCRGQTLANDAVIADVMGRNSDNKFDLIAKVQGG